MEPTYQMKRDAGLLNESLSLLAPRAPQIIAEFYQQLFVRYPQVRVKFPANMTVQEDRLLKAIIALVTHYDNPPVLESALLSMGRRHATHYRASIGEYAAVGEVLLDTVARAAGDAWNEDYAGAWKRAYCFAAGMMITAGATAGEHEPAVA